MAKKYSYNKYNDNPKQREAELYELQQNKTMPCNLEAEASLLCSILMDNSNLVDVVEVLSKEDFYKEAHGKIFQAMLDLFQNNEPIDLVSISNNLEAKKKLDDVGGSSYIAGLLNYPVSINVPFYAKLIKEKAMLRELIDSSNKIKIKCYEQEEIEEIIDFAQTAVFDIIKDKKNNILYPIEQLINRSISDIEQRKAEGISGLETGFKTFDKLLSGLQNSDLIILAARPSMGKTAFALNVARNVAVEKNAPVAFFSLEMSKEQLSTRLLTAEARVDAAKIKNGYLEKEDWDSISSAADTLNKAPLFIDDSEDLTCVSLRTKAKKHMLDKGLSLIIIDYVQLMKPPKTRGDRRDLEIAEISRSLKALAKELDIPILALSQVNRLLESRKEKRPMLSDLKESGALEQDADVVAFIYRDEVYDEKSNKRGTAELIVAKHRNGATGKAYMYFQKHCTRFENMTKLDYESLK